MEAVGVVAEYNPFHKGHALHLARSWAAAGEDAAVVCVMSGDFVQRGEAASFSKAARAEAACRCGADLVVELPLPWALSSAEGFARGALGLLGALGATHLGFGSETGETAPLQELARTLLEEDTIEQIRERMAREGNLSFAAAREQVLTERLGEKARLLRNPNDILAVEYLKAAAEQRLDLLPLAIRREGAGHDETATGAGPCSASELRRRLQAGESLEGEIPAAAEAVYARARAEGRELKDPTMLEIAVLSRLRMLAREAFERLPDGGDGLGLRLWKAVQEEGRLEDIAQAAKSKRYALSRLRRMCLAAALGLDRESAKGLPPYARVLAFNERGQKLLREGDASAIPLLAKPAQVRQMGEAAERVFRLGAGAHDLYALGLPTQERPGEDWRRGPARIGGH